MSAATAIAQEPPTANPRLDACVAAPTRACVLDEALIRVRAIEPAEARAGQLAKIADAYADAGNIQAALQVVQSMPADPAERLDALHAIAGAQARAGRASEAKETFIAARELAESIVDQLRRAEALQSLAKAQAEAGMATEAASAVARSVALARTLETRTLEIRALSQCAQTRIDGLLKASAELYVGVGNISDALGAARAIKYDHVLRAQALEAIAEAQARSGSSAQIRAILKEALEAVHAAQTPVLSLVY
jgi:tetratricopeptide (TPR) repeat protein